jgi:hypothetical protein
VIGVTAVRLAMGALGVVHAVWGVWARFFPRNFFENFPGFGRRWTAAYPPYNEHLVTDLGATFLTLAVLLVTGAVVHSYAVRTVALVAVGLFSGLHLDFHARHTGAMAGPDLALSLVSLVVGLLVPVALLVVDRLAVRRRSARMAE